MVDTITVNWKGKGSWMPKFDSTYNFGHVMTASILLFSIIGGYFSFSNRLGSVETQLNRMASIMEISIRQDEKIKTLMKQYDQLSVKVDQMERK